MQYRLYAKSRQQRYQQCQIRGAHVIHSQEMIIEPSSGNRYCYDMVSNRIDVFNEGDVQPVISPITFGDIEKVDSLPNIDTFILELTQNCNFRCSYCCYGGSYEDNRIHSTKVMSDEILKYTVNFIARHHVDNRRLHIVFYGGEPTLYPEKIKFFVDKAKGILPEDTDYTISTNGSLLLKNDFLRWCVDNDFTLNISYDGTSQSTLKRMNLEGEDMKEKVLSVLSQIKMLFPNYWENKVNILVTLPDITHLQPLAIEWSDTHVLQGKAPYLISKVAPCKLSDYDIDENETLARLRSFLEFYSHNRDNIFAETYFNLLCSPIIDRPIFILPENYTPLVCLPYNNRCYIDAYGNIGICEKTSDKLRLGDIYEGWDYDKINDAIAKMAGQRKKRCTECECFRFCKTCFTNFYYKDGRWQADCNWQQVWCKIALTISLDLLEHNLVTSEDISKYSLREIEEKDIPSIHRIMSNENVAKWIDGLEKFKDFEKSLLFFLLISEINANFAIPSLYAIVNEESNMVGIVGIDEVHDNVGNLFFVLDESYWGKGIMTKILAEYLQKYVSDTVKTIKTHINAENKAALRLVSKFSNIEVSTS